MFSFSFNLEMLEASNFSLPQLLENDPEYKELESESERHEYRMYIEDIMVCILL